MTRSRRPGLLALLLLACGDRGPPPQLTQGSHAGLTCDACHAGAVTEHYVPPVTSANCSTCHAAGTVAASAVLANVTFAHLSHPSHVDGAPLPCSTCHGHASGDSALSVNSRSCNLCHAEVPGVRGRPAVAASMTAGSCAGCHDQPTHTAFARTGAPIDHATVLARGVSCLLCHYDVVVGTGAVAESACRSCHSALGGPAPPLPGPPGSAGTMHVAHAAEDRDVACERCHAVVDHRVIRLASALVLECRACHTADDPVLTARGGAAAHRPEQLLYTGLDPHRPEVDPAIKFRERVACTACHPSEAMQAGAGTAGAIQEMNDECIACHGDRFRGLLRLWLRGMQAHTSAVGSFVRAARADTRVQRFARSDSAAREAHRIWAFIDSAGGVHNLPGADALLRSALATARASYRHAGVEPPPAPRLGPDPAAVSCARCHYGIQLEVGSVYEQIFDHGRHIMDAGLACNACHGAAGLFLPDGRTFDPAHGMTHVSAADCADCHHVESATACGECHARATIAALDIRKDITISIPFGSRTNTRTASFAHAAHASVACASCHAAATAARPAEDCASCHRQHHEEVDVAGCAGCHTSAVQDVHERVDHLSCGACHTTATLALLGTADRAFCLQCHPARREHEPAGDCATCHLLRSPENAMRAILGATVPPRGGMQ